MQIARVWNDSCLYIVVADRVRKRVPTGLALETLGCDPIYTMEMAEKHAPEVLKPFKSITGQLGDILNLPVSEGLLVAYIAQNYP